jgi:metallothionein
MEDQKKCAHPSCTCMAPKGENYCSQYCKDAGKTMELSCNCGHPGCAM